jgi:hypothetical protein
MGQDGTSQVASEVPQSPSDLYVEVNEQEIVSQYIEVLSSNSYFD